MGTNSDDFRSRPSIAARIARERGDVDLLIEMVSSDHPKARVFAAAELRKMPDPRAVPALLGVLERPGFVGKNAVLKALREFGDRRAVEPVFAVASDPSEPFGVRGTAARTLLSFGDRRGVTVIASLFGERAERHHSTFRKWALPLLVEARGTEALPALRAARSKAGVMERRRLDGAIRTLEGLLP